MLLICSYDTQDAYLVAQNSSTGDLFAAYKIGKSNFGLTYVQGF